MWVSTDLRFKDQFGLFIGDKSYNYKMKHFKQFNLIGGIPYPFDVDATNKRATPDLTSLFIKT